MTRNNEVAKVANNSLKKTTKRHAERSEMLLDQRMSITEITEELNLRGFKIKRRSVERNLNALKGFNGLIARRDQTNLRRKYWSVETIDFIGHG